MKNEPNSKSSTLSRFSSLKSGESGFECFSKKDRVRLNHSVEKMSIAASLFRFSCQLYTALCCRVGFEPGSSTTSFGAGFDAIVPDAVAFALSRVRLLMRRVRRYAMVGNLGW
jgi:hypothetical protein